MGIEVAIAAAGLAISAAGAYTSYQGSKRQASGQEQAIAIQQKQEAARQRQMQLDATRRQREIIRQRLAFQAQAQATATAQGAGGGQTSAVPGATGQISGRTNVNLLGVQQNLAIGNEQFGYNRDLLSVYRSSARAGSQIALGQGISSLGGTLMANAGTIARIGGGIFPGYQSNPWTTGGRGDASSGWNTYA